MKTMRQNILAALDKNGELTIDELMGHCNGVTRGQLSNNLQAARTDKLVTSRVEEGQPLYKITEAGRKRLKELNAKAPAPAAAKAAPKEENAGSDTPCCNAAKVMATTAADEIGKVREQLKLAEALRDEHFADLENARGLVKRQEQEIAELKAAVDAKNSRIEHMDAEIAYKTGVIADMSDKLNNGERPPVVQPSAYAVARPGKPLRRFKKDSNAQADAMASARTGKTAEVFALLPVGRAVPGAEWKAVAA